MSDYEADRRLYNVMKMAGWRHELSTNGFRNARGLWVSWGQAEDALRLADEGEKAVAAVGQSDTLARIINAAENDR
jgi:hypothetical protein